MYQFYYSNNKNTLVKPEYKINLDEIFKVNLVRISMWEEHCLECSAPACFKSCTHYIARKDGRCKRFQNGIYKYDNIKGNNNEGVRIKFRKWANMMSIIYPALLTIEKSKKICKIYNCIGKIIYFIINLLPAKINWFLVRSVEYLKRLFLKHIKGNIESVNAFIFHGYSFEKINFRLIMEIYDNDKSLFKMSFPIHYGENLNIVDKEKLSKECFKANNLIKIYPENDIEAELDILWCDFVSGVFINKNDNKSKIKCVVWDLDNTIWDGTLIECEDPKELKLRNNIIEIIKMLDERGVIQSISSKNDFESTWPVVQRLGISDYFLYPQIHWNAKSESIKEIAKNLNIGIDTFALIDDSPFERNQVKTSLPQVRVYDACEIENLLERDEFDVLVTNESKVRRIMYKAEEKRNEIQKLDNSSTVDFIKKCNLRIIFFHPIKAEQIDRCYELIVRTNQLNMSGKKYTKNEFNEIINKKEFKTFGFSCSDDYGEYGIVGFLQYYNENNVIIFNEFAMSCRVAGKFVESSLFSNILKYENSARGIFNVIKTQKNILLRNTLKNIGFNVRTESDKDISFEFNKKLLNSNLVNFIIE